ncbi:hypothetical protein HMPREF1403_01466 [Helicobacter pylori GAM201Ai]|nr:hypothetical protein HMPREF1403_01466 [Helicobacter pylori GAM201Ai]
MSALSISALTSFLFFYSFSLHSQRFKPLFCFVVVFVVAFLQTSL